MQAIHDYMIEQAKAVEHQEACSSLFNQIWHYVK